MDAVIPKQTTYGTVEVNVKNRKMYTHKATLSDGSPIAITSWRPSLCKFSIDTFKQEGEAMLARRKFRERYLAKKAKQASE
jgi:hypothetical protein